MPVKSKPIGSKGWCGTIQITDGLGISTLLTNLPAHVRDIAQSALCDLSEAGHRAYDEDLRRAYCFERQGLEFHYHWWEEVPSRNLAENLLEVSLRTRLPFKDEYSEQIYLAALSDR